MNLWSPKKIEALKRWFVGVIVSLSSLWRGAPSAPCNKILKSFVESYHKPQPHEAKSMRNPQQTTQHLTKGKLTNCFPKSPWSCQAPLNLAKKRLKFSKHLVKKSPLPS